MSIRLNNNFDNVDGGDSPSLNFGLGDFSFSYWIKTSSTNNHYIISKGGFDDAGYRMWVRGTGSLDLAMVDQSANFAQSNTGHRIDDGFWHLIVVTVDRLGTKTFKIYDNSNAHYVSMNIAGVVASLDSQRGAHLRMGYPDIIAGSWKGLHGDYFNFRQYNRVLTPAEIQAMLDDGNGCDGVDTNLVLEWRMGTEAGVVVTEQDISPNSNDGTGNSADYAVDPFIPCVAPGGGRLIDNKMIAPLADAHLMIN